MLRLEEDSDGGTQGSFLVIRIISLLNILDQ